MGKTAKSATTTKSLGRTASSRTPSHYEWHSMAASHRCPSREIFQNAIVFHRTISSRFYRWRKVGIWQQLWSSLMQLFRCTREDRLGSPLCRWYDCARSPACSWCKGGDPQSQALGRSVGGLGTKVHVKAEGFGKPINFVLTGGERACCHCLSRTVYGWKSQTTGKRSPQASQPVFSRGQSVQQPRDSRPRYGMAPLLSFPSQATRNGGDDSIED